MEPLSYKLRPKTLSEVVSHEYLVSKTGILSKLIISKKYFSFILHGNPGVGKTTIALCFAKDSGLDYYLFNASTDDKNKLKQILDVTNYHEIILIVDEIHRMNNNIQEVLLPFVERGKVILIGLTTLSPYHAVNIAIRSRCQIFELKDLGQKDIVSLLNRGIDDSVKVEEGVLNAIAILSNNEARSAINLLEALLINNPNEITLDDLKTLSNKPNMLLDKNQEFYYELLSCLQKSIRGSDVDASLYYLAKLILLGDLKIIIRRLLVIAYEDIGLANPNMGMRVYTACEVAKELGWPEAQKMLSNIAIDMALSPKSNTADNAIYNAISFLENNPNHKTPDYIINSKIKLNPTIYRYPHNDKGSVNSQYHLPEEIKNMRFYFGKTETEYETNLVNRNKLLKKLKNLEYKE